MVYDIVKKLEDTASTNEKQKILESHKNNDLLKQFFHMALNPHLTFGIKKIPEYEQRPIIYTLEEAMQELNKFSDRELTGSKAINHLKYILGHLSEEDANIIKRIIKKEPDCKVYHKIINKVWKKCVPVTSYMRCASANDKNYKRINYPAIVQKKANGMFLNIIYRFGNIELQTRNGKTVNLFDNFNNEFNILDNKYQEFVVMGEALVLEEDGTIMERKKGNGLLNKAIQGTITEDIASRVIIDVWDVVSYENWVKGIDTTLYNYSLKFLEEIIKDSKKIKIIETKEVDNFEEAYKYFMSMINKGEEGAVLKNLNGIWKDHTSPNQVKMKVKDPADLLCVGTYPHKKKPEWIGGLNLESSDGIIKVNTGSGMDDSEREIPSECYVGQIIEIEYNEITSDKRTGQKSLFLPIYKGIRMDKYEADSYELILERSSYKGWRIKESKN